MPHSPYNSNELFTIQITLSQYPILRDQITSQMFDRLVSDGYTTINAFEERVREFALFSQKREGLQNPFAQEAQHVWEKRLRRVRYQMICAEFSRRYPISVFTEIVDCTVQNRDNNTHNSIMWHNIHYSTVETIFEQALSIERMPGREREIYAARLTAAKVALIRKILCDQLPFIAIAREVFSVCDLIEINQKKMGRGPVGGKSSGIILANRILQDAPDEEVRRSISTTEAYYIGADEFYSFMSINNYLNWIDQKYDSEENLRQNYPIIIAEFMRGDFPQDIVEILRRALKDIDGKPFVVRSSSLLEDSFERSFTGMYEGYFIANQASPEQNLEDLLNAIRRVYASVFDPNVLIYLKKNGLIDYPERMGIMLQVVSGNRRGSYYYPDISGVASSATPIVWKGRQSEGKKQLGFMRFMNGIGTRVIRRAENEYPLFIDFAEPDVLHSVFTENEELFYQREVDVLNLKLNQIVTVDAQDVMTEANGSLPWIAQAQQDGSLLPIAQVFEPDVYALNFKELVTKTSYTRLMRDIVQTLKRKHKTDIYIEFTTKIETSASGAPSFAVQIHKCRPAIVSNALRKDYDFEVIPPENTFISSNLFTQNGIIDNIQYILFIDPDEFGKLQKEDLPDLNASIGEVNLALAEQRFIMIGARRSGVKRSESLNGMPLHYSDISNALALVELSGWNDRTISDPPIGTQLFQNLTEAGIYMIVTNADLFDRSIDKEFFYAQRNIAEKWLKIPEKLKSTLKVFPVEGYRGFHSLSISMNPKEGKSVIYFK